MFDNLRDSSFYEEETNELYREPASKPLAAVSSQPKPKKRGKKSNARFLGMTAQQRFILSTLLFFTVCVMGVAALFLMQGM